MSARVPVVGDTLGSRELRFSRDALVRYAGASGDFNPIHYLDSAARAAGLDGVIAHGMLTMGAAIGLVIEWAGDPGAIVEYAVRFSRPVPVPETGDVLLEVTGQVTAVEEASGTATIALSVTCDGRKILGKATATVRLPD